MKTLTKILIAVAVLVGCSTMPVTEPIEPVEYRIEINVSGWTKFLTDIGLTTQNSGMATYQISSYCARMLNTMNIYGVALVKPVHGKFVGDTGFVSVCVTEQPPTPEYGYICELIPGYKYDRIEGKEMVCLGPPMITLPDTKTHGV